MAVNDNISEVARSALWLSANLGLLLRYQPKLSALRDFSSLSSVVLDALVGLDLKCMCLINAPSYRELNLVNHRKVIRKKVVDNIDLGHMEGKRFKVDSHFIVIKGSYFALVIDTSETDYGGESETLNNLYELADMLAVFCETVNNKIQNMCEISDLSSKQAVREQRLIDRLQFFLDAIDDKDQSLNAFQLQLDNRLLAEVSCLLPQLSLEHDQEEIIIDTLTSYIDSSKKFVGSELNRNINLRDMLGTTISYFRSSKKSHESNSRLSN